MREILIMSSDPDHNIYIFHVIANVTIGVVAIATISEYHSGEYHSGTRYVNLVTTFSFVCACDRLQRSQRSSASLRWV